MIRNILVNSIETEKISIISVDNKPLNIVSVNEPEITVVSAGAGLQGIPGKDAVSSYAAKTLVYTGDALTEILLYTDVSKTVLAERRVLERNVSGNISEIKYYNQEGILYKIRTLTYDAGQLSSVVDTTL